MVLQPGTTHATRRILLVEDECALRQMLARVLRRKGYDLVLAANGSEAVALGDDDLAGVDLLISDLIMPGASGADVAAHVRSRLPNLGVVFISGCGDHPVLDRVRATGETVLGKPFTLADFSAAVHHALGAAAAPSVVSARVRTPLTTTRPQRCGIAGCDGFGNRAESTAVDSHRQGQPQ